MDDRNVISCNNLDEAALVSLAQRLAAAITQGGLIYLIGDLGAGKTTFARALIKSLGVAERVKSPTYSLIESYRSALLNIHHLDLYRIADPGELEWLGLADLLTPDALLLVEWPERAGNTLPSADLQIRLSHAGLRRDLVVEACSAIGKCWMSDAAFQ
ncbi:tRNA (adenosine(37)-N6)-threonylcarbamoyltransferase complex ATPase subunit type 1 TsaE [Pseudolysobacter antarcticus]|uniref:tRNA threonylcarbamoyladenosine biosynthesis protein TsaE n=1 Tax=Pseudolysobacter antarcticus TaxID=2511995 RepID=A0A411HKJ0_9GAMM|nr:tRNA (adenosine(37)-N6)-threonylcarbamoyltransferase complex ATPase subunit type 1 TsaE [Pseudolysobacter antarcticus]QBB70910.1 tRNA (adenosine(37)-N6)-threonylcarbamoyltransferase complex ATPase subunit type 1 TsaE [Pseudolysobacter antarcticus]